MTRQLNILPAAEADLSDIWDYTVESWSLSQARIYATGITDLLFMLCEQPEIAQQFTKTVPPVRFHHFRSHVVIFAADDTRIDVIRVVHARSNWQVLLAD